MSDNRCVFCQEIIPEGRQVCPICFDKYSPKEKLPYEKPTAEIIEIELEDIVTCSDYDEDYKPGHGWGDKNHDHRHWKDGEDDGY